VKLSEISAQSAVTLTTGALERWPTSPRPTAGYWRWQQLTINIYVTGMLMVLPTWGVIFGQEVGYVKNPNRSGIDIVDGSYTKNAKFSLLYWFGTGSCTQFQRVGNTQFSRVNCRVFIILVLFVLCSISFLLLLINEIL